MSQTTAPRPDAPGAPDGHEDQDSQSLEQSREKDQSALGKFWGRRSARTVVGVYAFLVVLLVGSRLVSDSFGSFSFVRTVVALSAFAAVVAFGQYIVVLTGGLDLSIPNTMALSGVILTGVSLGQNARAWWVVPLVLLMGAAIGTVNGLGIVLLNVSPVVMTLAVNVILSGVVLVYTGGTPRGFVPPAISKVIQGSSFGGTIPNIIILMVVFTILGIILINKTVFGRRVYAVGSNRQVAYLSGVRVNRVLVGVYAISGGCAALGGIMLSGYGNQSYLGMGDPYLLLSLAAVVVGGSSILGGRGLYLGVLGGAIILTTISTTLAGTTLPEAVRQIVFAVAIIAAVLVARQQNTT